MSIEPSARAQSAAGYNGSPWRGAVQRGILVIEDHADTLWAICALLDLEGHNVDQAMNGLHGLRAILAGSYDIALVDLNLPGINGYELARRTRAAGKPIVLIAFTGAGLDRDEELAYEAGFDAFVIKPVSDQALLALVNDPPRRR